MRIAILLFLLTFGFYIQGQTLAMKLKMQEPISEYPLIIEANPSDLEFYLETHKAIKIGSSIGNFHTIYVNYAQVKELYIQKWIKRIEDGKIEIRPLLDSARILSNIDSIHSGLAPLSADYKGRNVLIGIIDFGIEWRHLDFKNSPTDSRILGIWDQNKDSIAPNGYTYGHWWSKSSIDSGSCKHPANGFFGHGTSVAGIAVGNGNSYSPNVGIAPQAKILAISLKNNNAWLSNILDGIHLIFKTADSLKIPAIVNLSVGSYDGSHDGRDASTRMIEASLNKKGRTIVAAAGNAGHINQHIRFTPNNDTTFTDFTYSAGFAGTYFNFWADTSQVRNLTIGIQADSNPTLLPLSLPYFFSFKTRFLDSLLRYGYYEDSMFIKNALDTIFGQAFFYILKQENTVNFQCYIKPKKTNYLWRFTATGKGILDMWVHPSLQSTSSIYSSPLPSLAVNPSIHQYRLSDQASSLVSGFQCSDKIITVGNYVNKYGITDIDNIYRPIGGKQNEIASNSSKGPTRDGRIKPDIVATGGQVMTTIDFATGAAYAASPGNRKKLGATGKYAVAGGTSMASPVVAGALALLMEKDTNYWSHQILYLLKKTAKKDTFTTVLDNNTYGYGKLDGFKLLTYTPSYGCRDTGSINYNPSTDFEDSGLCVKKIYGCMDTGSINYNPLANINNGSCIKKVYGCTDTGSINYNPLANVNNGSCIKKVYGCTDELASNYNPAANVNDGSCLYTSIIASSQSFPLSTIYPNPTKDQLFVVLPNGQPNAHIAIYSQLGNIVIEKTIHKKERLSLVHLSKGTYLVIVYYPNHLEKYKILLE